MSNTPANSAIPVAEPLGRIGASWGWLLAYSILTGIAGVVALTWPGATILVIAIIFGVQLLVGGIFWFVRAISTYRDGGLAQVLLAVLAIVAGVVVLRSPAQAALVFPLVLGLFWTVGGIIETFHTLVRAAIPSRGLAIVSGVLSIVAGIVLLAFPGLGLVALTYILGVWLVVYGIIGAIRALQMRPHGAESAATPPHAGPAHA